MIALLRSDEVLRDARRRGASDLHFAADRAPILRVHGKLLTIGDRPLSSSDIESIALDLFSYDTLPYAQSAVLARLHSGESIDVGIERVGLGRLRVHAFRSEGKVQLALRFHADAPPALASYALPADLFSVGRAGLVLFVGPTGSGKTSLLASVIASLDQAQALHLIAIEDPIEFRHTFVRGLATQREVGRDVADFAAGIRDALRADPDVIAIGELRDPPAIRAALRAAATGRLVVSTVHADDAVSAIERLVDAFDSDRDAVRRHVASTLRAVVALRLVPRADGTGRIAITEVLRTTEAVQGAIRDARTHHVRNFIATGRALGMHAFADSARMRLDKREISASTAYAYFEAGSDERP